MVVLGDAPPVGEVRARPRQLKALFQGGVGKDALPQPAQQADSVKCA